MCLGYSIKEFSNQHIEGILTIGLLMHQISSNRYHTKGKNLKDLIEDAMGLR